MTSKLVKLILTTAFLGLAACDKGGSDDKKTTAAVPAAKMRTSRMVAMENCMTEAPCPS